MKHKHWFDNSHKKIFQFLSAALAALTLGTVHAATGAPGGFLESDDSATPRAALSASAITAFLPDRGGFTFPAPYDSHGVRVTNSGDCGGQDCVDMIYSYWRNMSNSAGSDTMYIFIGLDKARGGDGPTLFEYNKSTDALTKVGPLFASTDPLSKNSAEGWYFSYGMPTKIYLTEGSKLERYDVLTHAKSTVFDSTAKYSGTILAQANSSNDDDVHSATLENASTYKKMGCIAYKASTKHFYFYAANGKFDECQIDKSGRYLEIKELLPSDPCKTCDEDDVIVDLQTGNQQVILDKDGAGGHSDLGYGYMVASDNWDKQPNAWRVWNLAESPLKGSLVYHGGSWGDFAPSHVSFANASKSTPINQQYVCGSAAVSDASGNDIRCFLLDGSVPQASEKSLVVAPAMSDPSATGGNATCPNCQAYGKDPKGNLDPTGQYFFWVSNAGGSRMDAFMVKVPSEQLTGVAAGVDITSPANGSTVTGALTVTASVPAGTQVAGVTFQVDGKSDTTATDAPYKATWAAGSVAPGPHTLTAVVTDTDGNTASSAPVAITVTGDTGSGGGSGGGGGGGSMGAIVLLLVGVFGLWRAFARR